MPAEYETRPGWALCYSSKNKTQDWQADFTGVTVLNGQKFWVNVWLKTGANGEQFLSVNLHPKEGR